MTCFTDILIDAARLRVGGGVQVASSFINDLTLMQHSNSITVLVSDEVYENVINTKNSNITLINFSKLSAFKKLKFLFFNKFKVSFTVFGPSLLPIRSKYKIVGFALPWMIYPNNEVFNKLKFINKLRVKLQHKIKWILFGYSNFTVVEASHVKDALITQFNYTAEKIAVIPNCCSTLYLNEEDWLTIPALPEGVVSLAYVTRDYPHKNLDILGDVGEYLASKYNFDIRFIVTLTENEYLEKSDTFKKFCFNIGLLKAAQCPMLYKSVDAVIFPSLLECFSAMPIEAMFMEKTIFASDRKFVSSICKKNAIYFEPTSVKDISETIYSNRNLIGKKNLVDVEQRYFSSTSRSEEYLTLIKKHL